MKLARTVPLLLTTLATIAASGAEAPSVLTKAPRERPDGQPSRAREEARRRRQMAARGRAEARARCARGEHRAAGESMPGACADCGVDWGDLDGGRAEEGGER